jgi:hypothetical protein
MRNRLRHDTYIVNEMAGIIREMEIREPK